MPQTRRTSQLSSREGVHAAGPDSPACRRILVAAGATADRRPHNLLAARPRAARSRLRGARREPDHAIAPVRYAQRLTGMTGRLTSIYVRSRPQDDREVIAQMTRLAAGRLNVAPADFTDTLFHKAAEPTNQSTNLFSAISALVGFLFAFNALLLTVPQRRNLIEDLRLDGYTRKMIVEVLLFDALVPRGHCLCDGARTGGVAVGRAVPLQSGISVVRVPNRLGADRHVAELCDRGRRRTGGRDLRRAGAVVERSLRAHHVGGASWKPPNRRSATGRFGWSSEGLPALRPRSLFCSWRPRWRFSGSSASPSVCCCCCRCSWIWRSGCSVGCSS